MANSSVFDDAWIIVRCFESYANDIKHLDINTKHKIVYEDNIVHEHDGTPFGDEYVYFGLFPRSEPLLLFGTNEDIVHFQLAESMAAGRQLRLGASQFRLKFSIHRSWVLEDLSSNGSKVDQDVVASYKARGLAASRNRAIQSPYRQRAIHPVDWNQISLGQGRVTFWIKVGKTKPPFYVSDRDELDLQNFNLQNTTTTLTSSMQIHHEMFDLATSEKFLHLEDSSTELSPGKKLLMDKFTGQRVVAELYKETEKKAAEARFKALFDILQEGRDKNLIPFREATEDEDVYTIVSEYWPAKSLSELFEESSLSSTQIGFVFAQINTALSYLHSKGLIHRNIHSNTIMIDPRKLPVLARLSGFSKTSWTNSAVEIVGGPQFRAPEMDGNRPYNALVDVFSLCKVIEHHLVARGMSNALIEPIIRNGLVEDPRRRATAAMIHKIINSMTDEESMWPFQSLTLLRRFEVAWYRDLNDTYVRLSDLYGLIRALADPCHQVTISPIVKSKIIEDQDCPGEYCRLLYARQLFDECGLETHGGFLNVRQSSAGVFRRHVDLRFNLYYHHRSQMFNVTTLLKTVSPEVARVATWDLSPQVQEVHGVREWDGNFIDRDSFERVLERIKEKHAVKVVPNLTELSDRRFKTRFASVNYSSVVVVATKQLAPPWVLLARENDRKVDEGDIHTSYSGLRDWCLTNGLHDIVDRLDQTLRSTYLDANWKVPLELSLPPLGGNEMTSILSTQSSSTFRKRQRRNRPARFSNTGLSRQQSDTSHNAKTSFTGKATSLQVLEPANQRPSRVARRRRPDTTKLEKFYHTNKPPTASDYEELARETKMEIPDIRKWFQNRRRRDLPQVHDLALAEPQLGEGPVTARRMQSYNQHPGTTRPFSPPNEASPGPPGATRVLDGATSAVKIFVSRMG